MADLGDVFKNVFFAGVGAVALTGEAAKDLIDKMVAKGEITVEQGRNLSSELREKAAETGSSVRDGALEARMSIMSAEEREQFAAKAAALVEKLAARDAEREAEQDAEAKAVAAPEEEAAYADEDEDEDA